MLFLFVSAGHEEPVKIPIPTSGFFTIGRAESCDVQLQDPRASSKHCRLEGRAGRYWLVDLDSRNGTTVNGETVTQCELHPGDTIRVGQTRIVFGDERTKDMVRLDPVALVGEQIGEYEITEYLSRSVLGVNLLATQLAMSRTVVVKVLPPHMTSQKQLIKRFHRQVDLGELLDHPNIAATYDAGYYGAFNYIVSEHVEGVTLAQWLADNPHPSLAEALDLGVQIADALAYLGRSKVTHRNLNPGNVLVQPDGVVKLVDLWLAKSLTRGMMTSLTGPGRVLGSLTYMPPEQIDDTASADPRADIYALGAILFQLVCGRPPFIGDTNHELVRLIRDTPPPDPRQLNPEAPGPLADTILKALAKEPKQRHGKARRLLRELKAARKRLP